MWWSGSHDCYYNHDSGVLAVWSAKAGAAKVLAVEYTDMAKHARTVVQRNGVADVVEVRAWAGIM